MSDKQNQLEAIYDLDNEQINITTLAQDIETALWYRMMSFAGNKTGEFYNYPQDVPEEIQQEFRAHHEYFPFIYTSIAIDFLNLSEKKFIEWGGPKEASQIKESGQAAFDRFKKGTLHIGNSRAYTEPYFYKFISACLAGMDRADIETYKQDILAREPSIVSRTDLLLSRFPPKFRILAQKFSNELIN